MVAGWTILKSSENFIITSLSMFPKDKPNA